MMLCLGTTAALGQTALSPALREALAHNAQQLGPLTVSWTQSYVAPSSPAETRSVLKLSDQSFDQLFGSVTCRLSWQDGKVFIHRDDDRLSGAHQTTEYSFDGESYYSGAPSHALATGNVVSALVEKTSVSRMNSARRLWSSDYLDRAGFGVPQRVGELSVRQARSTVLALIDDGGSVRNVEQVEWAGATASRITVVVPNPERAEADAIDLAALEADLRKARNGEEYVQRQLSVVRRQRELPEKRVVTFYLDPAMGYAVRQREERYEDGRLLLRVTCDDFRLVSGREIWLPHRAVEEYCTYVSITGEVHEQPVLYRRFEVSSISTEVLPDKQFVLAYDVPGTVEIDGNTGVEYTRPAATPAELEAALASARRAMDGTERSPTGTTQGTSARGTADDVSPAAPAGARRAVWRWVWAVAGLTALLAAGLFLIIVRQRRDKHGG
jgi:hypothetical protein